MKKLVEDTIKQYKKLEEEHWADAREELCRYVEKSIEVFLCNGYEEYIRGNYQNYMFWGAHEIAKEFVRRGIDCKPTEALQEFLMGFSGENIVFNDLMRVGDTLRTDWSGLNVLIEYKPNYSLIGKVSETQPDWVGF